MSWAPSPHLLPIGLKPDTIGLKSAKSGLSPLTHCPPLYQAGEWAGLQTIVIVERTRHLWNQTTHEIQFYLSSLPSHRPRIAPAIRQHWGIENSLDWTLDVTLGKMLVLSVLCTPHTIWGWCGALLLIPSTESPLSSTASDRSRSRQQWIIIICLPRRWPPYLLPLTSYNLAVNSL